MKSKLLVSVFAALIALGIGFAGGGAGPQAAEDESLVLYLKMDEGEAEMVKDSSGNGIDGTLVGCEWAEDEELERKVLRFDGQDDFVKCGKNASLNFDGNVTLLQWVKPEATQDRKMTRLSSRRWDNWSFCIPNWTPKGGGLEVRVKIDGKKHSVRFPKRVLKPGAWQQVGWSFDGEAVNLIKDGKVVHSKKHPGKLDVPKGWPFVVGTVDSDPKGKFFNGSICEVRIWNKCLSEEEIENLYNEFAE